MTNTITSYDPATPDLSGLDHFSALPSDFLCYIFSPSEDKELGRYCLVNKKCKAVCESILLKRLEHAIYGKALWERHFGKVGDEPPVPSSLIHFFYYRCRIFFPRWGYNKIYQTHSLVLMPATLDEEPFGLEKITTIVKKLNKEEDCENPTRKKIRAEVNAQSKWVVCTKLPIPSCFTVVGSRKTFKYVKFSYKVPSKLEMLTCCALGKAKLLETKPNSELLREPISLDFPSGYTHRRRGSVIFTSMNREENAEICCIL